MRLPLLHSWSFICIIVSMLRFCSASQPVCNVGIYGIPDYRDCLTAWNSIPFALEPLDNYGAKRYQLWSEPQYLLPPFKAVWNRYRPLPINQLPKIWRYSTLIRSFLPNHFTLKPLIGQCCCYSLTRGFSDTCRLALMSYGRPNGSVVNALWGANWRAILDQMQTLFECGKPRSGNGPSGGYIAFISM